MLPVHGARGLIPGPGIRSHIPQLRVHMLPLKVPSATTKTRHRQMHKINKQIKGKFSKDNI